MMSQEPSGVLIWKKFANDVSGAGSTWTNSSALIIGNYGDGALAIANGGAVSSDLGMIGNAITGTGTVTGDGAAMAATISLLFAFGAGADVASANDAIRACFDSTDFAEGVKAFMEKRAPRFGADGGDVG